MKFQSKHFKAFRFTVFFASLFLVLRSVKLFSIVGSCVAFFRCSDMVMPLIGNAGLSCIGTLFAVRFALKVLLYQTPLSFLLYHIPGVVASAYWAFENKMIAFIVPLICMITFLIHPIGFAAAPYALYWFIPITLYFVRSKTIFMHSLSSTFIAHAIGSVIWLYVHPMSPAFWLALIPVVAVERLMFASGMTFVYHVSVFAKKFFLQQVDFKKFSKVIVHD
jgi:hypothetical protein